MQFEIHKSVFWNNSNRYFNYEVYIKKMHTQIFVAAGTATEYLEIKYSPTVSANINKILKAMQDRLKKIIFISKWVVLVGHVCEENL